MDIDIDIPSTIDIKALFPGAIQASRVHEGELVKHPCGMYFETIPVDKLTGLAAIPYDQAEKYEVTKVDFLHLTLLNEIQNKQELRYYQTKEPNWALLNDPEFVSKLFQLKKSWDFIRYMKPTSIEDLADVIAIIRPSKRSLLNEYLKNKQQTRQKLFRSGTDDKTAFRRSHAIAYALLVVVQMNKLEEQSKTAPTVLF